jgi:hypothetical protein
MPTGFAPIAGIFPGVDTMARVAWDGSRVYWFWYGMLAVFPLALALLGAFAPVILKPGASDDAATRSTLLLGCLVLGFALLPALSYFVLFNPDVLKGYGRGARWLRAIPSDAFSLWFVGSMVMLALLATSWMAFIAIPKAFLKLRARPSA